MNFHVGQKVVCVEDSGKIYQHMPYPVKGNVYRIRSMPVGRYLCLRFVEIVNPPSPGGFEPGYGAWRFRPVKTTDISIFTKMLAPTPKEREPAGFEWSTIELNKHTDGRYTR